MTCLNQNHRTDPQNGIIWRFLSQGNGAMVLRKPSSVYWKGSHFRPHQDDALASGVRKDVANPATPLHDLIQGNDEMKGDDPDAIESIGHAVHTPAYYEPMAGATDAAPEL